MWKKNDVDKELNYELQYMAGVHYQIVGNIITTYFGFSIRTDQYQMS